MQEDWKTIIITRICTAVYVAPNTGKHIHKDRPSHGFVINDSDVVRDYCFDDGHVMRTEGHSLFYLPKGSSYHVEQHQSGGCYAINFEAEIADQPFSVALRAPDALLHSFKAATDAWKRKDDMRTVLAMRAVYDGIWQASKELQRQYVSGTQKALLTPAIEWIERSFTENGLSVSELASICGVSEVYFRRLFLNTFGVSPKEYVIQKRMDYAKALLRSGNFSVSEVAMLCGYSEPCHFSREFSRRVGVAPGQYM